MKHKRYLLILIALLVLITACQAQNDLSPDNDINEEIDDVVEYSPVEGGNVILPLTNFDTLNPLMTENSSYYFFSKLIFEGLFDFDKNLNIIPQLAKDYTIENDGKIVVIQLKDNIFWHDGERFTAYDVEFTINTIKYANADTTYKQMFSKSMGSFSPSDIRRIMDVSVLDDTSIQITFDRAFSNNLEVLTFPIIPKHRFSTGKGSNQDYKKALEMEDYTPIGTGPYKFHSYEKTKEIILSSNENYREGKPYIDNITGMVLDNEEDILTAFETGQIHMATTISVDWDKYEQNSRIKAFEFVSGNYEFLGFNFEKEIFSGERGRSLRKAIAYGIDRQSIIQNLYLGHGTQIDVPIHPDSWLLSDKGNTYGYNLELAKKEISKLGWADNDKDGILEDEEGNKITLNLLTNTYNLMRLKTAELIKEDLEKLGIAINIIPNEEKTDDITLEDIENQWEEINDLLSSGNFDMVLLGWQLSVIPDLSFAFHSSQIEYNTNFIRYSNDTMDQLLETVFLDGNRDRKIEHYDKLQSFIIEDLPYVSLFFKNKALLVDTKIMGELDPTFFNPYRGIEKAYIPKELQ
ncbi:MAG: peptide ABC transporter substrate-binding protein [Tissierellia bacterium]|nr:peptide ABC transporter substrate-binding protein [Tissierellia bacterium]